MKNVHIMKIGGMVAIVCFLFLPVAGCGPQTINGVDLLKMDDIDISVKIFAVLAMVMALGIIFLQDKLQVFFSAIAGLIALVVAYLIAKSKMHSGNDFGMADAIELKSGSYLSMLGFIISAVVSKTKNELLGDQQLNFSPSNQNNKKQSNFCASCGKKVEDSETQFCENCGSKL